MRTSILNFLKSEDGPTAVEYAVMLSLIVVASLSAINALAQATGDSFDDSANQISGALGS